MKLFFVDTETGGLNPSQHSLLALGYVIYDDEKMEIIEKGIIYHKANEYTITPTALKINKLDLIEVYENGDTRERISQKIKKLKEKYSPDDKFMPAGWNLQFDAGFLKILLGGEYEKIFYYKGVDVFTLYYLVYKEPATLSDAAIKVLGEHVRERQWHDALEDILTTVEVFESLKSHIKQLRGG